MIVYPKYLKAGDVFGRLTVIEVDELSKTKDGKKVVPSRWLYKCKCTCGNTVSVQKKYLCEGSRKSCGCLHREVTSSFCKSRRKTNRIEIVEGITKVFFFNTDNYALIDTEDYSKIKDYCWYEKLDGYVKSIGSEGREISLHCLLTNPNDGMEVDHKNRNKLDNRKQNLRICTHAENARNKSLRFDSKTGCNGVHYRKDENRYCASIGINGTVIYLGRFKNKQDAINARKEAEIKYFKEFAPSICRPELQELYA